MDRCLKIKSSPAPRKRRRGARRHRRSWLSLAWRSSSVHRSLAKVAAITLLVIMLSVLQLHHQFDHKTPDTTAPVVPATLRGTGEGVGPEEDREIVRASADSKVAPFGALPRFVEPSPFRATVVPKCIELERTPEESHIKPEADFEMESFESVQRAAEAGLTEPIDVFIPVDAGDEQDMMVFLDYTVPGIINFVRGVRVVWVVSQTDVFAGTKYKSRPAQDAADPRSLSVKEDTEGKDEKSGVKKGEQARKRGDAEKGEGNHDHDDAKDAVTEATVEEVETQEQERDGGGETREENNDEGAEEKESNGKEEASEEDRSGNQETSEEGGNEKEETSEEGGNDKEETSEEGGSGEKESQTEESSENGDSQKEGRNEEGKEQEGSDEASSEEEPEEDETVFLSDKERRAVTVINGIPFVWVSETEWKYSKEDFGEGWLYQQYLKMYLFEGIADALDTVLIVDSETVFLRPATYAFRESPGTRLHLMFPVGNEWDEEFECMEYCERILPAEAAVGVPLPNPNRSTNPVVHHMIYPRSWAEDWTKRMEEQLGLSNPTGLKEMSAGLSEYLMMFSYFFHFHRPSMRIVDMPMNGATSRCKFNITEPLPEWVRPPVTMTCHSHVLLDQEEEYNQYVLYKTKHNGK